MADRRLRESGGPAGGTTGGYIDSFENMPGAQNQPFGAKPPKAFVPEVGRRVTVSGLDGPDVAGLVCEVLPGPLPEAAVVVRLDHPTDNADWIVLEPRPRWSRSGDARVERWSTPPSGEPWLDEPGIFLSGAAPYAFD